MTFWETFIATMAGALAGALVGALAAWCFSRNLAKNEREHLYRDLMDALMARIVESLRVLADELDQTSSGLSAVSRPMNQAPPPPRVTAFARARGAIDAATAQAKGRDFEVLVALGRALTRLNKTPTPSPAIGGLIDSVHAIRFFAPDDYDGLLRDINDFPYGGERPRS